MKIYKKSLKCELESKWKIKEKTKQTKEDKTKTCITKKHNRKTKHKKTKESKEWNNKMKNKFKKKDLLQTFFICNKEKRNCKNSANFCTKAITYAWGHISCSTTQTHETKRYFEYK